MNTIQTANQAEQSEMGIEVFKNSNMELRGGFVDREPYFVLVDICNALALSNPTKVAQSIDEDDLTTIQVIDKIGRKQNVNAVNESGLYQVIFQSRKAEAKQFKIVC